MGGNYAGSTNQGPVPATKLMLRRFVQRIVADANGALKAELVIGRPRQHNGSRDEFALSNGSVELRGFEPLTS